MHKRYQYFIGLKICAKGGMLEYRPQNLTYLKNFNPKIFIFEYFPTNSSEMDSTHPFYAILLYFDNFSFVKQIFYLGPKNLKKKSNEI